LTLSKNLNGNKYTKKFTPFDNKILQIFS